MTMKKYFKITGLSYVGIFVLAIFANFLVIEKFVVADASQTFLNVVENANMFRWAASAFIIASILDIFASLGLYFIYQNVNKAVALLSTWMRIVHATLMGVATYKLLEAVQIVGDVASSSALENTVKESVTLLSLHAFENIWLIGLVFFGVHLFCLGYLIYHSGFTPKVLTFLLALAGLGYVIDSFAHFLISDYENYASIFFAIVATPSIIGEMSFTIWLLYKGFKKQVLQN
jgi:hypothetical protein